MLNKEEIKKIIPQREPFLMIDEIEDYIPGQSAVAYKNVNENELQNLLHKPVQLQFYLWKKIKVKMLYLVELIK